MTLLLSSPKVAANVGVQTTRGCTSTSTPLNVAVVGPSMSAPHFLSSSQFNLYTLNSLATALSLLVIGW